MNCPTMKAEVRKVFEDESRPVKAILSVTIDDAFAIHGVRLAITDEGKVHVNMPARIIEKDGKKRYLDYVHPINSECRSKLETVVYNAYKDYIEEKRA